MTPKSVRGSSGTGDARFISFLNQLRATPRGALPSARARCAARPLSKIAVASRACLAASCIAATREYLELFRAEYADEVRAFDGRLALPDALAISGLQQYIFADYWSAGAIASAFVIGDEPVDPELVGLYTYSCGFSGPYYRRAEPSKPLLADELPEPLRAVIGGLRLSGLSFATTQSFDPETFVACQRYR